MKFAHMEHSKSQSEFAVTASFFFNARGQYLEKSIIGMYRSLLLQLLEGYPELQTVLDDPELVPPRQKDCPPLNVLKQLFRNAILALSKRSFTCFIDALDECDEQQVVDMVQSFEDLTEESTSKGILFRICFSSRHYPYIFIRWGILLTLENQKGHAEDLVTYISSRLRVEDRASAKQLQSQLLHKAAGVFMWVVLVVDILNKESRRGGLALGKRLEQIPSELSDLFKDILTRDKEDMEALLLCILWILYAKEPLRPQELYHALWSGLSLKDLVDDEIPDTTAQEYSDSLSRHSRYVISSSKGLAETTKSKEPTVQFIHESIRDFLVKDKGLQELWPEFGFDCESPSHEMLKQCCSLYINHTSVHASVASVASASMESSFYGRMELSQKFPFLKYATQHILHHANAAAKVIPQDEFLSSFPISHWICASNCLDPDSYSTYPRPWGKFKYPLFAALEKYNEETTFVLLNSSGIHKGADNITDKDGNTPFQWAINHPITSIAIASLLIEKGANFNITDEAGWTPLFWALRDQNREMARFLIEQGVDINIRAKDGRSPLHLAVINGKEEIVKLLIDKEVDINASDNCGRTPLLQAVMVGSKEIAELLIDKGAQVNIRTKVGYSILQLASINGHEAIKRLLIDKGAKYFLELQ
ncbi:Pfs NACHT and ankyrin domain protein [Penicillium frequentans]|nr:Pfs NACHT and ankyrin domain protein [Penicillium glabrum]